MASNRKHLLALVILSLLTEGMALKAHAAEDATCCEVKTEASNRAEIAALGQSQKLALNLLILTTVTNQKMSGLVKVDESVAKKYQYLKNAYIAGVPVIGLAVGTAVMSAQSSAKVEFLIKPLTAVLRASGRLASRSSTLLDRFTRLAPVDFVLKNSSSAVEKSYAYTMLPFLKLFMKKGFAVASGASSTGAVLTGSVMFLMNDSKDAMSYSAVRAMLGENADIRHRVDKLVGDFADVFELSPTGQAQLKLAIFDEAIRQGVANNFSDDKSRYSLDVVDLMKKNNLISEDVATAVESLRKLADSIPKDADDQASLDLKANLSANISSAIDLASLLESQLASERLQDRALRAEIQRMLGGVVANLKLMGFDLKK